MAAFRQASTSSGPTRSASASHGSTAQIIDQQAEIGMGLDTNLPGEEQERDPGLDEDEELEEDEEEAAKRAEMMQDDGSNQLEHDVYESESLSESGTDSLTWISWFCSLPGHEYFAEVGEDFIEDDFNLTGLNALVPFYKEALEMILDVEPQEDSLKIPDVSIVESSAELLYGLIHQRYILTRQGLQQMAQKYERGEFGFCPRVFCHSHPMLPCGRSDLPGLDTVKLFCANCIDNYSPPSSRFHGVDGAFFGTTFPHLLFQTYRDLAPSPIAPPGTNSASLNTQSPLQAVPQRNGIASGGAEGNNAVDSAASGAREAGSRVPVSDAASASTLQPELLGQRSPQARLYTPRIYGFRVSELAKSGPRMRWLRMRPESFDELDRCLLRADAHPASAASIGGIGLDAVDAGRGTAAGSEQSSNHVAELGHSVTPAGRSTATGRPIAGRTPTATNAAADATKSAVPANEA